MQWVKIDWYPYEVSSSGQVRRVGSAKGACVGKVLRPTKQKNGYLSVCLSTGGVTKRVYVHALVAAAFLGSRPLGKDVNHKNGDKRDNAAGNLEYASRSENIKHAYVKGLNRRGESRSDAKLTDRAVRQIRFFCRERKIKQSLIGQMFGVAQSIVSDIHRGVRWAHVTQYG